MIFHTVLKWLGRNKLTTNTPYLALTAVCYEGIYHRHRTVLCEQYHNLRWLGKCKRSRCQQVWHRPYLPAFFRPQYEKLMIPLCAMSLILSRQNAVTLPHNGLLMWQGIPWVSIIMHISITSSVSIIHLSQCAWLNRHSTTLLSSGGKVLVYRHTMGP